MKEGTTNPRLDYWAERLGIDFDQEQAARKVVDTDTYDISDASFEREQVIYAARDDLNFLAALAMPTIFKFDFPTVLLAVWQLLGDSAGSLTKRFSQLALGIPRGHAKTTLMKLFILYCILFTKKQFILVISSTASNAENVIADVADMLDEGNIKTVFGDWHVSRDINRQDLKKFSFRGRTIILGAVGASGSIRGLNVKHVRPDVMIFEDIQTKECSESPQQSQALERWMIGTAMKAKSPSGCTTIFVGNMYPGPNSILKKLKDNPGWIKFISGAILADSTALWPALHSYEDLIAELDNDISMGHPEIFFSEVLNDTEAGINSRTDLSLIKPWAHENFETPQGKYIIIDPSNNKFKGDAMTIGRFEVYDGTPALVEIIEDNLSPGNTIRSALALALRNNIRLIAVESNAYQYTLLYWFGEICTQLGITGIEAVDVYSGSYSKNSRISNTLRELTSGEIELHDRVKAVVCNQIANWNPLKRDNEDGILDLLSYSRKVLELYGNSVIADDSILAIEGESAVVQEFNSPF